MRSRGTGWTNPAENNFAKLGDGVGRTTRWGPRGARQVAGRLAPLPPLTSIPILVFPWPTGTLVVPLHNLGSGRARRSLPGCQVRALERSMVPVPFGEILSSTRR
jgi:hypothetical protein